MAEKETQGTTTAPGASDETKNTEKKQEDITIPKARFDEVNDAKKELEDKLAKIELDKKEAEEARLKEEGKTKELLEIREKEIASLKIDGLRRDLIQDAITNNKLNPKLAKMVTGLTEAEIKQSLEDAIAYQKDVEETFKNGKTAKDDGGTKGTTTETPMSTEEWMTLYKKDPEAANEYLRKITHKG